MMLIDWIWRSRVLPIYWILLMFGIDTRRGDKLLKAGLYRMLIRPRLGVDRAKVIKAVRQIYGLSQEDAATNVSLYYQLIEQGDMWQAEDMWWLREVSEEDVYAIRKYASKNDSVYICYDELGQIEDRADREAKRKLRAEKDAKLHDKIMKQLAKDPEWSDQGTSIG